MRRLVHDREAAAAGDPAAVRAPKPPAPAGCDYCHGEPMVLVYTDPQGRDFWGRCSCELGSYLRAQDLKREARRLDA